MTSGDAGGQAIDTLAYGRVAAKTEWREGGNERCWRLDRVCIHEEAHFCECEHVLLPTRTKEHFGTDHLGDRVRQREKSSTFSSALSQEVDVVDQTTVMRACTQCSAA